MEKTPSALRGDPNNAQQKHDAHLEKENQIRGGQHQGTGGQTGGSIAKDSKQTYQDAYDPPERAEYAVFCSLGRGVFLLVGGLCLLRRDRVLPGGEFCLLREGCCLPGTEHSSSTVGTEGSIFSKWLSAVVAKHGNSSLNHER